MNKLLMFFLRRKYRKKLLNAARDIALGKQTFMCLALDKNIKKLPLFNQEQFKIFINKRYPELVPYLEPKIQECLPWIILPSDKKESKEFRFLIAWAKSEYLEWIAYNL